MRGNDPQQGGMSSYISPEQRVRKDHPLRPIRAMVDQVLKELSPRLDKMYAKVGRPSIPPEQLLRALLLQMLYSARSERLLVEEIDYNIVVPMVCGIESRRSGVGRDHLYEEP
jgi:transposase